MSANKTGYPRRPPGLEHIDTAANLKALSDSSFNFDNESPTDITFTIIPPTANIDGSFDDERVGYAKLQQTDASFASPNPQASDTKRNGTCSNTPSHPARPYTYPDHSNRGSKSYIDKYSRLQRGATSAGKR
ncbi:hypothetical protein J132_04296 [Termitomyces sp. J132]|nr:hypothetical protein H2248_008925 [Termitomyces sp. 'cryptogamus']KNZ80791.1 hypothetical protein J132_04296 [Termitomyces sp. J132]